MKSAKDIERLAKSIRIDANAVDKHRILKGAQTAMQELKSSESTPAQPNMWRLIMKNNASKLAASIIIITVVLSFLVFDKLNTPAWALDETIEALRDFRAIHMVGAFAQNGRAEHDCEIWMRADKSQIRSKDIVIKINSGVIQWVEDGSTYTFMPQENKVYYENAITAGMAQWPGPVLFETLSNAKDSKIIRGRDPATGRERATLLCSLFSVTGPQSWMIEFDVKTKLPIVISIWNNLDRQGTPFFKAWKITYYEDLPDSIFTVSFPEGAQLIEKPLIIPESNLDLLSNPQSGISTEGLSREEACRKILGLMYEAIVNEDFEEFKRLCPTCATWGDDLLRYVVLGKSDEERIVELVEIRPICKEGRTKLGPIVAVPWILKYRNGVSREDKQIIQFREINGQTSCVIHGPYGLPREIE